MGLTSLQVCMDSSDHWLQGTGHEDPARMELSPSPLSPNDILTCSQPLSMERRLRPPHDQVLKCPRCESTHTKFCYYNNYSLSQPRYFCKTCRRYWTKGGTLRNIPVGGGCRKNKKASSKKQNDNNSPTVNASSSSNTTDLHMSFPEHVHLSSLMAPHHQLQGNNFMPIEFMESKLEGIVGNSHRMINSSFDFLGSVNVANGTNNGHNLLMEHNFHPNVCTPFGMTSLLDGNQGGESSTFGSYEAGGHEVKPSARALLSLDWPPEQVCSGDHIGRDSFGYINGLGNWTGAINNYGPSNTNPLV